ncbi:signal peptidase II [Patescibacteria group bacterium]|nr:signal peptidase II [Patescibacteria group bacterium]
MNKYFQILEVVLLVVVIDQLSKFLVPFFGFDIILNQGISFNYLNFIPSNLMTVLMLFFVGGVFLLFKKEWLLHSTSSGIFFGGVISNILDRIFFGAVKDWLRIPFFDVYNNLADWFIFVGLAMFLLYNSNNKIYKKIN